MRVARVSLWALGIAALSSGAASGGCSDESDGPVVTFDAGRRDMATTMPPPPPPGDDLGMPPPPPPIDGGGGIDLGGMTMDECGGVCGSSMVCCGSPLPCAGMCVPDCRLGAGCPLPELTCSATSGVCEPAGMSMMDASMPPRPDGAMMMPPDGGTMMPPDGAMMMPPDGAMMMPPDGGMMPPDGGMMPRDGGMMPRDGGMMPRDGGMSMDSGGESDSGSTADAGASCIGTPPIGGGVAEDRIGSTTWTALFSGNFTSISGTTAAIGNEGTLGGTAGYARIFVWNTCTSAWELQQMVTGSGTTEDDVFGSALSLDGNVLAVGANMRSGGPSTTGAVYVFRRSGTTWTQDPAIYPPAASGGRFGRAVSIAGNTLAVGAPLGKDETSTISYSGIVSIFTHGPGSTGPWTYRTELTPAALVRDDAYGYALDLQGDTLVASAPGAYVWGAPASTSGKVWIWTGSADAWTETAYLTASDGETDDWFGKSVSRFGDVVVVGAPNHDVGAAANAGAAYVFTRAGGVWSETAVLHASAPSTDAYFGFTVAAVSATRVVVGAAGADRLYSFTSSAGTWTEDAATYATCSGHVGYTLDVSGQLAISARPGGAIFDLSDPDDSCVP